jgi:hypothetical protein
MANTPLTETGEKIVLKDHDILIAVHTLQTEMMRRFDDYAKVNDERHSSHVRELHTLSIDQVKINGDIAQIKGMYSTIDERIDKLEAKNLWMTAGSYLGVIVAGTIAWFKS